MGISKKAKEVLQIIKMFGEKGILQNELYEKFPTLNPTSIRRRINTLVKYDLVKKIELQARGNPVKIIAKTTSKTTISKTKLKPISDSEPKPMIQDPDPQPQKNSTSKARPQKLISKKMDPLDENFIEAIQITKGRKRWGFVHGKHGEQVIKEKKVKIKKINSSNKNPVKIIDEPLEIKEKGSQIISLPMEKSGPRDQSNPDRQEKKISRKLMPTLSNGGTKTITRGEDHYLFKGPLFNVLYDQLVIKARLRPPYDQMLHNTINKRINELKFQYNKSEKCHEKRFGNYKVQKSYNKKKKQLEFRFYFKAKAKFNADQKVERIFTFLQKTMNLNTDRWKIIEKSGENELTIDQHHITKELEMDPKFFKNISKAFAESEDWQITHMIAKNLKLNYSGQIYLKELYNQCRARFEAKATEKAEPWLEEAVKVKPQYQKQEFIDELNNIVNDQILQRIENQVNNVHEITTQNGLNLLQVQESANFGFQDLTSRSRNLTNILVSGLESMKTSFNDTNYLFEDILNKNNSIMKDLNSSISNPNGKWEKLHLLFQGFPERQKSSLFLTIIKKNYQILGK